MTRRSSRIGIVGQSFIVEGQGADERFPPIICESDSPFVSRPVFSGRVLLAAGDRAGSPFDMAAQRRRPDMVVAIPTPWFDLSLTPTPDGGPA